MTYPPFFGIKESEFHLLNPLTCVYDGEKAEFCLRKGFLGGFASYAPHIGQKSEFLVKKLTFRKLVQEDVLRVGDLEKRFFTPI